VSGSARTPAVLGLCSFTHDSAAALISGGSLTGMAVSLLFPVADEALDTADPADLAAMPRPLPLVYVGNQYDRDEAFARFFAPAADRHAQADELYAVWDGKPARAHGGTADVVAYAREQGTPRARDLARRRTARLTAGREMAERARLAPVRG
jgi:hypothetical protein